MAQIFLSNVYRIDSSDLLTVQQMGFNPTNVRFEPVTATLNAGPSNSRVYGKIIERPTGLLVNGKSYYVVETVAQLAALANA